MFSFLPGMILWLHLITTCGFTPDFVPCYTWMKNRLQTLIVSYISGTLSSPSSQTSQLAVAAIPTFLTLLKCFTLEEMFLKLWYTIPVTLFSESSLDKVLRKFLFRMFFVFFKWATSALFSTAIKMLIWWVGGFQYVSIHSPSIISLPSEPTSLF